MKKKLILVFLSLLLLSPGWLGFSGLSLLVALVPLLIISDEAEDSKAGWWSTFYWALAITIGWNLSCIWWISFAAPVGTFGGTLISSIYTMTAFMCYHTVRKKAPKALAYLMLISLWISFEWHYQVSDFSWPWLLLGNGFSRDIWAVQWYEWTGIFGGSLWVLLSNIAVFEAIKNRRMRVVAASIIGIPLIVSLFIYFNFNEKEQANGNSLNISVLQPNIDPYTKFSGTEEAQEKNIYDLISECPSKSQLLVLPETAIPRYYEERTFDLMQRLSYLKDTLNKYCPKAEMISGANTLVYYKAGEQSETARKDRSLEGGYYDVFNSAVTLKKNEKSEIRHKAKLVIGVENTPSWIFKLFKFFVVDLGGVVGQIGRGDSAECFDIDGTKVGAAICYEALYGEFYGDFVRDGAQIMTVISNDGWWENTPGHKLLYSISALRAIEYRRAIARSANTGISGFITARGDSTEELRWEERGVLNQTLLASSKQTVYMIYGDYIARIAKLFALLSILYYIAFRFKRRQLLN